MRNKILAVLLTFALTLTLVAPAWAASGDEAAQAALSWLKGQQSSDGGFTSGFSPGSDLSATADVIIALAAAGQDAGMVQSSEGLSPLDYVYQQVSAGAVKGVGTTAKLVLAVVAAGLNPADVGGKDLVGQLETAYDPETGSYGGSLFDQALVVLALVNAGHTVPQGATDYLMAYQTTDGAWSFTGDTAALSGDTNTTALVIQALAATGRKDDAGRGLAYLRRVQNDDGGWPYQNPSPYGTETDANSTALVIQAVRSVGQSLPDWYVDGSDPLGALIALQNSSGSLSYQASFPGDNALATIQAIPTLAGATLAPVPRTPTQATPGTGGPAPTLLPESGAAAASLGAASLGAASLGAASLGAASLAGALMGIGLLLVVVGAWLRRTRKHPVA